MPDVTEVIGVLGQNISRRRKELGWTQTELAEKSELHRTYIADVERGFRNVSIQIIIRISRALKVSVSELCLKMK